MAKGFGGRKMRTVTLGRGRFPRVHYRNTLWMRFDEDRLLIRPHVLFRWAHPPLIIPRAEIEAHVRKGLLRRFAEMKTAADPAIGFHLPIRHYGWPEDLDGGTA
ncbi:hypothetical protein [Henriciella aquimarina]|uniref:hypothetical protein n=1 Tax=Henriciella aquimarina TaxID=545261 RepID=UPI000A037398|nr:hypothetical protein [Henriciella aquimarina]